MSENQHARADKRQRTTLGANAVPAAEWRKFHKVTPVADAGTIWLAILGFVFYGAVDLLENGLSNLVGQAVELITLGRIAIGVGIIVLVSLIMVGIGAIMWRFKSFAVIESGIHFRRGVIFKEYDHMRWDRIQSVEVQQRLFGRLFGYGSVKIEAAGYDEDALDLGLLTKDDCALLRAEILRGLDNVRAGLPVRAHNPEVVGTDEPVAGVGTDHATSPGAITEPESTGVPDAERTIYTLPNGRLVVATLLSGEFIWALSIVIFLIVVDYLARDTDTDLFVPMFIAFASGVWPVVKMILHSLNTVTAISRNGLRSRAGLTELVTRTLPPTRIHAVRLKQPMLWRRKNWWRIELTIAGTSAEELLEPRAQVMPVGTIDDTLRVLHAIFPTLGSDDDAELIREAMSGFGVGCFMGNPPSSAKWLDPLGRKARGYYLNERIFMTREGRWSRTVDIVFQDHTQSTTIAQGPIQRRLGLATVRNDLLLGTVDAHVTNFSVDEMMQLLEKQDELTKRARAVGVSESVEDWKVRMFGA